MKQSMFLEKYPVYSLEITKNETSKGSVEEIVAYFKDRIAAHGQAVLVGVFDHHAHTRKLGGDIAPGILAAVNVVFCFGLVLPNAQMMAVRPRSIAVVDLGDHFLITFMEAPMKTANETMEAWAKALADRL